MRVLYFDPLKTIQFVFGHSQSVQRHVQVLGHVGTKWVWGTGMGRIIHHLYKELEWKWCTIWENTAHSILVLGYTFCMHINYCWEQHYCACSRIGSIGTNSITAINIRIMVLISTVTCTINYRATITSVCGPYPLSPGNLTHRLNTTVVVLHGGI